MKQGNIVNYNSKIFVQTALYFGSEMHLDHK